MVWDVVIRKRFAAGPRRFDLDIGFRSSARRLVLFGPSGAGKSVTMRALAGLLKPDSGHVQLNGSTLFDADAGIDHAPQRRRLGYVFQDYALFPHLTVRQNIAFGLRRGWRNPPQRDGDDEVGHWLRRFELEAFAHCLPAQLSGGQRQRTALARALVIEPRALLLDEPFAALDRALRARLREELLQLQAGLGVPLVLITHDEEDLRLFGGEVLHLAHGRVMA
jgi:molybdate transport system ATP-binding protein